MCSPCDCNQATKLVDTNHQLTTHNDQPRVCRKCGSEPFIVLDKIHIECKGCFLESCNKKLRSTIGKSKLLKNNDPILIAHSGAGSSTALLDLIKNSMQYDTRREQKFRPSILHIDTRSAIGIDCENVQVTRWLELKEFLSQTHKLYPEWPIYWTSLEMLMVPPEDRADQPFYIKYASDIVPSDSVLSLFLSNHQAHLKLTNEIETLDLTDRQEFIKNSITTLIAKVAEDINSSLNIMDKFKYIFTASSATRLANNLLVDVILGHGATIRSTVSVCDERTLVPIMRPMKDFSKKEIAFYLRARNLDSKPQTDSATFAHRKASIQKLTEAFLSKLYVDYPSTYSTLLRTGNKMQN